MCQEINTEFVLANMLLHSQRSISIRTLKKVRQRIEQEIPSVFVDVTSDSVTTVVECHPEIFRWVDDDKVDRAPGAEHYFSSKYVEAHINWRVPQKIRRSCLSILQD
ncbi:MAG: hypothetical protein HQ559_13915 [Lentisphaerae bacterium]|nr:hypothetical protein [Lentisphaerota bacterium]